MVPPLTLQFAPAIVRRLRRLQWVLPTLMVLSTGMAGWWWVDAQHLQRQAELFERAAGREQQANRDFVMRAQQAGLTISDARANAANQEITVLNRMTAARLFSWSQLLNDLEVALPHNVSISSIHVNFKDRMITLVGKTMTLSDLAALVKQVEDHPAFRNVVLTQHEHRDNTIASPRPSQDALEPVSFNMVVRYQRPEGKQ